MDGKQQTNNVIHNVNAVFPNAPPIAQSLPSPTESISKTSMPIKTTYQPRKLVAIRPAPIVGDMKMINNMRFGSQQQPYRNSSRESRKMNSNIMSLGAFSFLREQEQSKPMKIRREDETDRRKPLQTLGQDQIYQPGNFEYPAKDSVEMQKERQERHLSICRLLNRRVRNRMIQNRRLPPNPVPEDYEFIKQMCFYSSMNVGEYYNMSTTVPMLSNEGQISPSDVANMSHNVYTGSDVLSTNSWLPNLVDTSLGGEYSHFESIENDTTNTIPQFDLYDIFNPNTAYFDDTALFQ